jgi:hypothetical protein
MLSYYLERNLPAFSVTVNYIKPEEWKEFVLEKYKGNGWAMRLSRDRRLKNPESLSQLIWYTSGELIGDTKAYVSHIKKCYNVDYQMDQELLKNIAKETTENLLLQCQ